MRGPLFYSKILLFGEYGIIKDSKGLSIPYNFYKGALKIDESKTVATHGSNLSLKRFTDYLAQLQAENPNLVTFDIAALQQDVDKGLYFDSSIPQGYGVGSSGALVAAIYDKYAFDKITVLENLTREKLLQLKGIFSEMESFFHGKRIPFQKKSPLIVIVFRGLNSPIPLFYQRRIYRRWQLPERRYFQHHILVVCWNQNTNPCPHLAAMLQYRK